jgi:hypothetical protein
MILVPQRMRSAPLVTKFTMACKMPAVTRDTGDCLLYTVSTIGFGIAIAGLYNVGIIAESSGRIRG